MALWSGAQRRIKYFDFLRMILKLSILIRGSSCEANASVTLGLFLFSIVARPFLDRNHLGPVVWRLAPDGTWIAFNTMCSLCVA